MLGVWSDRKILYEKTGVLPTNITICKIFENPLFVENSVENVNKSLFYKEFDTDFYTKTVEITSFYQFFGYELLNFIYGSRPVKYHTARSTASREFPQSAPAPLLR